MKNYKDSDYALNKYSKGIVYRFADGAVEVTMEVYLRENPDKTESDFNELKALSDAMYYEQDRDDYHRTWKDTSLQSLGETNICAVSSPEDYIVEQPELVAKKRQRREIGLKVFKKLTEVQRRRYLMYHVKRLSMRQIADIEGAHFTAIQESLQAAERKIKKFLN